jgi:hypothetical protein
MSGIYLSFVSAKHIHVGKPITRRKADGDVFTTQRISLFLDDGETVQLEVHLSEGAHALATGEIVTNRMPDGAGPQDAAIGGAA